MRTVHATRYVTPLREGGSLPAIVEGDDDGLYVLKFVGAGQGPRALIAELVAGEIGRALGLPVPEIVFATIDADLARTEPDAEIQDLLLASEGTNLGLDFLPGALPFSPAAGPAPDPGFAAEVVWLDELVTNVDRTARNPNLLVWHGRIWLIDHGAALYWHHGSARPPDARKPFPQIRDHVLLPFASMLDDVDKALSAALTAEKIDAIASLIPDEWLADDAHVDKAAQRAAYSRYLTRRLEAPRAFAEEAERARSLHV